MTRSFKYQDKGKVQEICDKVRFPYQSFYTQLSDFGPDRQMQSRWPSLAMYESCWPVVIMVKLALKYTSEASKRQKDKETASGSGSARV